ncbi:hypothetical protein FAVG1_00336 [Fusarium avenaceum]|nr:hypothetical protein FAVG1_00336 [Fusarium avenaceum]
MPMFSLFSGKREVSPLGESSPKRVKTEDQSAENEAIIQPTTPVSAGSTKHEDENVVIEHEVQATADTANHTQPTPKHENEEVIDQPTEAQATVDANHPQATPEHEAEEEIVDQPIEVQTTTNANHPREKEFKLNQLPHVDPDNLEGLIRRLKEMSRAETDSYVEMKQDTHNFLPADEEEVDTKQTESKEDDDDLRTLEGLRIQRELMGVLLPKNCNLEEICRDMDVNPEGILWKDGIRFPGMLENAKPHQVIGANWICDTLNSAIRAAILADECGTGKTLQMPLALLFHYRRVKKQIEKGTFQPLDPARKFKPSIILCPSGAIARQILREITRWFGDFFQIKIFHKTSKSAPDDLVDPSIIEETDELEDWIDEKAAAHTDPETLRSIVITPSMTAVRRMFLSSKEVTELEANGSIQTDENQHGHSRRRIRKDKKKAERKWVLRIENAQFNWVMCDEGHTTRNPRTGTHTLVRMLHKEATLIVSATPLLNHQRDFWGYVNLFWRREWPFKFKRSDISPFVYYREKAWNAMKEGKKYRGLTMDHVLGLDDDDDDDDDETPYGPLTAREQTLKTEFVDFIKQKKGPLFLMNPHLYSSFRHNLGKADSVISQRAIKPLMKLLCIRRRMLTELTCRMDHWAKPSEEHKDKLHEMISKHIGELYLNSHEDQEKLLENNVIDENKGVVMNSAILRTLALATTAPAFYPLTRPDPKAPVTPKKPPTAADSENINKIISQDRRDGDHTHGLQWYYEKTAEKHQAPRSREDVVLTLCHESPKLAWALYRVLELRKRKDRIIIFVNYPLTSMVLTALLKYLSLDTMSIRSSHDENQRAEAVLRFNSPQASVDVLVTSLQLNGFGINFHGACHNGIVLEYPHNIQTLLNAFGRL